VSDYYHHTIIITMVDEEDTPLHQDMVYFLAELPERFKHLLIGPVHLSNSFVQYIFMASGGKLGGSVEMAHEPYRKKLLEQYKHHAVEVVYGDIEPYAQSGG